MLNLISAIHGTGVAASTNSYESIATVTVGAGGSSSISFSSIPSTFKHLQIRGIAKYSSAYNSYGRIQFNSDTSANYAQHQLYGDGSAASSYGYSGESSGIMSLLSDAQFGNFVTDVLDYTDSNKYKTVRTLGGVACAGSRAYVDGGRRAKTCRDVINAVCHAQSKLFCQICHPNHRS